MSLFRAFSLFFPLSCGNDGYSLLPYQERTATDYWHTALYRLYFPPVIEDEATTDNEDDEIIREKNEAKLAAEAEVVASELPSAPTSDPSDPGHAGKKQKQGED